MCIDFSVHKCFITVMNITDKKDYVLNTWCISLALALSVMVNLHLVNCLLCRNVKKSVTCVHN